MTSGAVKVTPSSSSAVSLSSPSALGVGRPLGEKEVLLSELHHRVKNNLAVVASLLSFQGRAIREPRLVAALDASRDRVRSMALVHELLYRGPDADRLDAGAYLRRLTDSLLEAYTPAGTAVESAFDVEPLPLPMDAILACGLIVNELVTNSLKHAFPGRPAGRISVGLRRADRGAELTVADDGRGLDGNAADGLGLRLVAMMVRQLDGSLAQRSGHGLTSSVTFPLGA